MFAALNSFIVLALLTASSTAAPPSVVVDASGSHGDWSDLSRDGRHLEALRALDAARQEVLDRYKVLLKGALPATLGGLQPGAFSDGSGTLGIALRQDYETGTKRVRVRLEVPTADVDQAARLQAGLAEALREKLRDPRAPRAGAEMQYLTVDGVPIQIQLYGTFATRPQASVYLSCGTLLVSALEDLPVQEMLTLLGELNPRQFERAACAGSTSAQQK